MTAPHLNIRKILLIRTDRLGDLLMNLPLIHRLKQNFPTATLTLVCSSAWAPLFHHHLDVNRVIGVSDEALANSKYMSGLMRDLRSARFDCVIMSASSKEWHWRAFCLGIPARIGFRRKWGFLLTHGLPDRKAESGRHEIDSNLELLNSVCPKPWNGQMELGLDLHPNGAAMVEPFGLTVGKKRIALHLSSSNPQKEIPASVLRDVITHLLERPRYQVILVGSDAGASAEMLKEFAPNPRLVNLIGRTNITELALVLSRAHCVVSTDSGPLHLAWIQKIPTVALFVAGVEGSSPERWGVYPGFAPSRTIRAVPEKFEPATILAAIQECASEGM
jgi:heptosyltransferase-2